MNRPSQIGSMASNAPADVGPLRSTFAADPDMAELVEYFVSELDERTTSIRQAVDAQDRETLRRLAHQLKGAAGGYGFPSITEAAASVEEYSKDPAAALEDLRRVADALIALCSRARVK